MSRFSRCTEGGERTAPSRGCLRSSAYHTRAQACLAQPSPWTRRYEACSWRAWTSRHPLTWSAGLSTIHALPYPVCGKTGARRLNHRHLDREGREAEAGGTGIALLSTANWSSSSYVTGREITVGHRERHCLYPLSRCKPAGGFYDFTAKYTKGMTEYLVPAQL